MAEALDGTGRGRSDDAIVVAYLVPDGEAGPTLAAALDDSTLTAQRVDDSEGLLAAAGAVDCLVVPGSPPESDGRALLSAVREQSRTLPVVLYDVQSPDDGEEPLPSSGSTVTVGRDLDDPPERLVAEIERLVQRERDRATVRRLEGALEAARTPILVADPDGAIAHANGLLTSLLSPVEGEIRGRPWQSKFTDAAADRLRREAIPVASDGWDWNGTTTLRAGDGTTVAVRIHLVGLSDGSLVFAFRQLDAASTDVDAPAT